MDEMVETVLKVDEEVELKGSNALREEWRKELKQEMREELRQELLIELCAAKELSMDERRADPEKKSKAAEVELIADKKVGEFPPGFLPRPKENKVYAIREDDYAFWDFLFGDGRKKERER